MDWDATSYTDAPHCIRRFDTGLTVADRDRRGARRRPDLEPGALGDPARLRGAGKTTAAWDTTLINSQFGYAPGTTFQAAAKATYDEALAPRRRDGGHDRQGHVRPPRHHVLTRPDRRRSARPLTTLRDRASRLGPGVVPAPLMSATGGPHG